MNDEYISVKEFSKRANITPQAVYKQLNNKYNNSLKKYLKVENGKKLLSTKGLELFEKEDIKQVEQPFNNEFNNLSTDIINLFNNQIDILNEQLRKKDEQIKELNERLKEANQLNQNNQILLKQAQEKTVLIEENNAKKEKKSKFFSFMRKDN